MARPGRLVFGLLLLASASCTASAQSWSSAEEASYPVVMDAFSYDPMPEMLEREDLAVIMREYRTVTALKDRTAKTYACRFRFRDWPCRRKHVVDVDFEITISDLLPITADQKEYLAIYIDTPEPGPYDMFLQGQTPPPVPYGIFDARDLARIKAMLSNDEAMLDDDVDGYDVQARSPDTPAVGFDAAAVEWALRNLLWQGIQDFTSFAPIDRVLHGQKTLKAIEAVADGGQSECGNYCPKIVRKRLGAEDLLYSYCVRVDIDGLELPPMNCTPIAFVVDDQTWLRTRLVYGVAEGRGAGPFEAFRCVTTKSIAAASTALADMLRTRFKAEIRTRDTGAGTRLAAVSWRDRPSEVAANRWEIFFFDGLILSDSTHSGGGIAKTVLEYTLPIYRLSDGRPSTIDAGMTPREEIVRSFEHSLRKRLSAALAPATCDTEPQEGAMP